MKHLDKGLRLMTHERPEYFAVLTLKVQLGAGEVCCLTGGLDECAKDSRQLFLTNFIERFGPQQSTRTSAKLIITSRRENNVEGELLCADNPSIQDLMSIWERLIATCLISSLSKSVNCQRAENSDQRTQLKRLNVPRQKRLKEHYCTFHWS